ncbi:hypothetical protein SNEBB_001780 [Seison nebaliae]|nr:hypothetical protein SNEBB_001780 [Seison nebaliae]
MGKKSRKDFKRKKIRLGRKVQKDVNKTIPVVRSRSLNVDQTLSSLLKDLKENGEEFSQFQTLIEKHVLSRLDHVSLNGKIDSHRLFFQLIQMLKEDDENKIMENFKNHLTSNSSKWLERLLNCTGKLKEQELTKSILVSGRSMEFIHLNYLSIVELIDRIEQLNMTNVILKSYIRIALADDNSLRRSVVVRIILKINSKFPLSFNLNETQDMKMLEKFHRSVADNRGKKDELYFIEICKDYFNFLQTIFNRHSSSSHHIRQQFLTAKIIQQNLFSSSNYNKKENANVEDNEIIYRRFVQFTIIFFEKFEMEIHEIFEYFSTLQTFIRFIQITYDRVKCYWTRSMKIIEKLFDGIHLEKLDENSKFILLDQLTNLYIQVDDDRRTSLDEIIKNLTSSLQIDLICNNVDLGTSIKRFGDLFDLQTKISKDRIIDNWKRELKEFLIKYSSQLERIVSFHLSILRNLSEKDLFGGNKQINIANKQVFETIRNFVSEKKFINEIPDFVLEFLRFQIISTNSSESLKFLERILLLTMNQKSNNSLHLSRSLFLSSFYQQHCDMNSNTFHRLSIHFTSKSIE